MNITTEDIARGITTWIEKDLLDKGNTLQKGITVFIYLQSKPRIQGMVDNLKFFADDGVLDSTELKNNIISALEHIGGYYTIPLIEYNLDKQDINRIFNYIED